MSKFLALFSILMMVSGALAADREKTVVETVANQTLVCDDSASQALAQMNDAVKELQEKASKIEKFVREVPGFERALFPVKTAIGENMRNVFEIRVFIHAPMIWGQVRAAMASENHATPFPSELIGTATEKTIQFPYGSCVRTRGDAKPLI